MGLKKNNPGCLCCGVPASCLIGSDKFTRSDEDPPVGWTEESGTDWAVVGEELTTATTSAILRFDTAHGDSRPSMLARAKVQGGDAGDLLRVFGAWEDSSNYLYAELELHATCGTLRLYQVSSGTPTQLGVDTDTGPAPADVLHTLTLCYREDEIHEDGTAQAIVTTYAGETTRIKKNSVDASATGYYGGVATGGTLTTGAVFDDFELYKTHVDEDTAECPDCDHRDDCTFIADNFDDDTIDCRWTQGGTWSESGELISVTGSGSLFWEPLGDPPVAHTDDVGVNGMYAALEIDDPATTTKLYIMYRDGTHHIRAELDHDTAGNGTIKIIEADGSDTTIESDSVGFDTTVACVLMVCYVNGHASAIVWNADQSIKVIADGETAAAIRANWQQVGFDSDGTADFESIAASYRGANCGACVLEAVDCGGYDIESITLTIAAADTPLDSGFTDTIAGTYDLRPTYSVGSPVACEWEGSFIVPIFNANDGDPPEGPAEYSEVIIWVRRVTIPGGRPHGGQIGWEMQIQVNSHPVSAAECNATDAAATNWYITSTTIGRHIFTDEDVWPTGGDEMRIDGSLGGVTYHDGQQFVLDVVEA